MYGSHRMWFPVVSSWNVGVLTVTVASLVLSEENTDGIFLHEKQMIATFYKLE